MVRIGLACLADTVSVKRGAKDGAVCSFKTAVVFSHRRFGILGLDESSVARPGETASAWGALAVGVATVLPISVFFGLTHRWEGQHLVRRRISHSFFGHNASFRGFGGEFVQEVLCPRGPVDVVRSLKFIFTFFCVSIHFFILTYLKLL